MRQADLYQCEVCVWARAPWWLACATCVVMYAERRSHVNVLLDFLMLGSATRVMTNVSCDHSVIVAFQCFVSPGNVLREGLCQLNMARLAFLRSLVVFICAHRALGGDVRVSNHDVIDIHMEEPASASLGVLSGKSLQERHARAVDGSPVSLEYESILQRQQRQTAEVSALYTAATSSTGRVAAK